VQEGVLIRVLDRGYIIRIDKRLNESLEDYERICYYCDCYEDRYHWYC
jgi:hypothetical protein